MVAGGGRVKMARLALGDTPVATTSGAEPLTVMVGHGGALILWLREPGSGVESTRTFHTVKGPDRLPKRASSYVGSAQNKSKVYHVFEVE